eukprot:gene2390-2751_t
MSRIIKQGTYLTRQGAYEFTSSHQINRKEHLVDLATSEVLSGNSDGKDGGEKLVSEICGLDMIPEVTEKQLEEEEPNEKTDKADTPDDSEAHKM